MTDLGILRSSSLSLRLGANADNNHAKAETNPPKDLLRSEDLTAVNENLLACIYDFMNGVSIII
jgi:hypothetical protein